MPYITQAEAELNVDGFIDKTQAEKDRLIMQASAFISSKCVPNFTDASKVPDAIKQAVYEAMRGIEAKVLMQGQTQSLKRKKVKADTVEVEKEFTDGSSELSAYEQLIDALIKPFANCNAGKGSARIYLRGRI